MHKNQKVKIKNNKQFSFFSIVIFACTIITFSMCSTEVIREPEQNDLFRTEPEIVEMEIIEPERGWVNLVGTNEGLFAIDAAGRTTALWQGGSVKKLLPSQDGNNWFLLSNEGVYVSDDLLNWEQRNQGLPLKTIKVINDGEKDFLHIVQDLKDLKINPSDPQIMVTATREGIYLTRDGGVSWTSLGSMPYRNNGFKAAASAFMPGPGGRVDLTVFVSNTLYGIFYIQPDRPGASWIDMSGGLERLETTPYADEVSDIAVVLTENGVPEIYVSQTFRRRIYKLDWDQKHFNLIWSDDSVFGTVDSLSVTARGFYFLHEGNTAFINFPDYAKHDRRDITNSIRSVQMNTRLNSGLNSIVMRENMNSTFSDFITLHELWLLNEPEPGQPIIPSTSIAANREGIFIPIENLLDRTSFNQNMRDIERAGLNMIVIDMKDESGRLRFTPNNPAIAAMGTVFRPLDIDVFLPDMKERGIYTVARIVVFKDQELFQKQNGRFAVWDTRNSRPWIGYADQRRRSSEITAAERASGRQFFPAADEGFEIVRSFYNEHWLDPYSEEVWEYIALICEELQERGIDEIQFDYIRFPTDGDNLVNAGYRWRDEGMDMESAILSFLRHVRPRISIPISIDIYGANGWYRTGARTGQEVEILVPWVDVICPMYYPSHFEQTFLAQSPPQLRPWRIYYHGTLRTDRIARGQTIVRSWAQAFYLNVSYDRQYYNRDYVRLQIEGVWQAGSGGYTYWNHGGRYADIPDK